MSKLQQGLRYTIRAMQDKDIPQVIDIDREAFPTQWPHPTYASLKQELRNRLASYIVACKQNEFAPGETKETIGNKTYWEKILQQLKRFFEHNRHFSEQMPPPSREYIIGMAGFWLMVGEAHLTTIGVRNVYQRQGIGEQLLISVIDKALQLNAHVVTLEVRTSNKQAQALYEKYGFNQGGIRRGYYSDNGEDAVIMSTDTITLPSFQSHFQQLKRAHEKRWGYCTLLK